ncbi:type VII toxin-antitoxin system HepT family RNase toxin [Sulfurovum riftiae]|uniref:type VII toxin-antitoxin system HepT family RNase toxin n=1 Tax=Sulfurovum riftiae TaxID=1630136 RepID=UPI000829AA36|nr:DUF86 domain-containing protein [Sulfurovum riftiae]
MRHKIEAKIKKVDYYVSLLEEYKVNCKERFVSDPMFEGALLHYLYLASDGCIAIAEMVLKYKNIGRAQSYYDAIDTLGEHNIIPREFAYGFAKIASFRNFLAHDYEKIDYVVICEEALEKLDEIREYLKLIDKCLK